MLCRFFRGRNLLGIAHVLEKIISERSDLMKKHLSLFLAVALAVSLAGAVPALAVDAVPISAPIFTAASAKSVPVSQNGAALAADAFVADSDVYLPLRAGAEALGNAVAWSDENGVRTITVTKPEGDAVFYLTGSSDDNRGQSVSDCGHSYYVLGSSVVAIRLFGDTSYVASDVYDAVFGTETSYDAAAGTVTVTSVPGNDVTIAVGAASYEEDCLKATIQYPVLSGLADSAVQDTVNAVFKKAADTALAEGRANAAAMKTSLDAGYDGPDQCETYFNYSVTYNRNGLLSVVLTDYQYSGGAHGGTFQSAYTFDLTDGRTLSLADLMQADSGWKDTFDTSVRSQIDALEATGELAELTGVSFSTVGDDPAYCLTSKGAAVFFQEYEYFPYAAGIQSFTLSYDKLAGLLKPEYAFLAGDAVTLSAGANALSVGGTAVLSLPANATTGYSWHAEVSDGAVLALVSRQYTADADTGAVGTGGTAQFVFRALKAGQATVTLRYYRDWEGAGAAAQTQTYTVTVR